MARTHTKVVRYLLKKIGYDLQRLQKTRFHGEGVSGGGTEAGFEAFEPVMPRPVETFDILFRSCARADAPAAGRREYFDATKREILLRCLNSLILSIAHGKDAGLDTDITLTVLDDHSDPSCADRIRTLLERAPCPTRFEALGVTGNGPSIGATLDWARSSGRDVVYFVEDDYLHDKQAVHELIRSYGRLSSVLDQDVVLFPSDYPDFYRHIYPCHVLLGHGRHWRRIPTTTFTFAASKNILEKHWDTYNEFREYGIKPGMTEATTINQVYKDVPCLSPLPGLAVHLQISDTLSPYADWRAWWERSETGLD